MTNKTSTHFFILLVIVILTAIAHYSIYYGAMIRGYETSGLAALRNLTLLSILAILPIFVKRFLRFSGNWTLYTSCVLLFSIGLTIQYRLFSDREYVADIDSSERARIQNSDLTDKEKSREMLRAKLRAIIKERDAKIKTLQLHYIQENYSPEKKQMMGLPATAAGPVDLSKENLRPAKDNFATIATSGMTLIPLFGVICLIAVFIAMRRDDTLKFLQNNFLGGFAAILAVLYKNLAKTYWGIPRAKDLVPIVFMAALPFFPFFVLKDFGHMMVFGSVYATLYLIAVRRFSQRFVLVGSVVFIMAVLIVGALPDKTQEKVPLIPTLAKPVKAVLPDRIQQRFHLWLDGFNPPPPETSWWKEDYDDYYKRLVEKDPNLPEMVEEDPTLLKTINIDAWFDVLAFQPAQATYGLASGGMTGRGLGLGYPELIPVADSDYIFAALAEELGLFGGLLLTFALIVLVSAGVRTALDSRDMFSKLCSIGLAAFIGFQALVNIGGITRALPMTGITLPFVSHGGFSLITSFAMLGMLMAFSHRNAMDRRADDLDVSA